MESDFMKQGMCLVCNDKRKYEVEVSQTRNIVTHLNNMLGENISNRFNKEENEVLRQLSMHNKHPHFMCGTCLHVNISELKNLEDKMDILLVKITKNIDIKGSTFHDTLRILQGSYSGKYHVFEQYCRKNQKNAS